MKTILVSLVFVLTLAGQALLVPAGTTEDVWGEVAAHRDISLPDPLKEVMWRTDVRAAMQEAGDTDRPLFVTFRCLPCKQCADFDASVLDGSPSLTPLLRQFITVRLTDAKQLDLSIFPAEGYQDFDLSWWGYFLSPEGHVYAVFGGKDHVSDATRISEAALVNAMQRVLEHHYDPRRVGWDIDGVAPDLKRDTVHPEDLPGYSSWRSKSPASADCIHCHQVAEILRQPALDKGLFDQEADLGIWPLPENVGIELDRDHGLLVTSVEDESAADRAGVRAGDELLAAGNRRLFGQADFRGMLHREANPSGSILIRWLREGQLMSGTLALDEGWRETIVWWRASVSGGNIGSHPGFAWPLEGPRRGVEPGHMAVKPWFADNPGKWPSYQAGLRPRHVVIAIGGESPDVVGREFMAWFRMRHNPGDEVVMTVLDRGERREIRYRLPQ